MASVKEKRGKQPIASSQLQQPGHDSAYTQAQPVGAPKPHIAPSALERMH